MDRLAKEHFFPNWQAFKYVFIDLGIMVMKIVMPKWKNKHKAIYIFQVSHSIEQVIQARLEAESIWENWCASPDRDQVLVLDLQVENPMAMPNYVALPNYVVVFYLHSMSLVIVVVDDEEGHNL